MLLRNGSVMWSLFLVVISHDIIPSCLAVQSAAMNQGLVSLLCAGIS